MKKLIILVFSTLCLSLEISDLKDLQQRELKGNFTQTKQITNFKKPIITSGDYSFDGTELLWDTKKPTQNKMKINKDGIYNFLNNTWVKSEANYDKSLFLSIINFDFEALKKDFDIKLYGNKSAWSVILSPKNVWIKKIFKDIKINGDKNVKSIEINEQNGDNALIEFHE